MYSKLKELLTEEIVPVNETDAFEEIYKRADEKANALKNELTSLPKEDVYARGMISGQLFGISSMLGYVYVYTGIEKFNSLATQIRSLA